MRVSRAQADANREAVIDAASRLFRQHGFDGIGLKDLMKGAGLTQGAFYKQFASKEDLEAQASWRAFESAFSRWSAASAANPEDPLGAVLAFYLSTEHRDARMEGCPIVALGADAARQGIDVRASFEAGIRAHLEVLGRMVADAEPKKPRRGKEAKGEPKGEPKRKAMAILATMVGALTLSRAVNQRDLAQAFLDAAAQQVRAAAAA